MKPLYIAIAGAFCSTFAFADVAELSQAQLRAAIAEDRAIPTRSLVSGVENFTGGEVVDIRAFIEGTDLIYRILYRGEDGAVEMILVDGQTGRAVGSASEAGQAIAEYVSANPGQGNAFGRSGLGNGQNNGNNGRGNNNRGGNGNGNSGGNGNGNGRNN